MGLKPTWESGNVKLYLGDCLEVLPQLDQGVDAIIADLPYGTTQCKWDTVIPLAPLWDQYKRLIGPQGAVVLFGGQPFTSVLVMSNPAWFKYDLVWDKKRVTGHLNAKKRPLRQHESVLVFCDRPAPYTPQMKKGKAHIRGPWGKRNTGSAVYGAFVDDSSRQNISDLYYPRSIIRFRSVLQSVHPTQKPVELIEWLVKTYTHAGGTVLDNTMGSGTTGVACVQTGRGFVGIEIDPGYFEIARQRIEHAQTEYTQLELGA